MLVMTNVVPATNNFQHIGVVDYFTTEILTLEKRLGRDPV